MVLVDIGKHNNTMNWMSSLLLISSHLQTNPSARTLRPLLKMHGSVSVPNQIVGFITPVPRRGVQKVQCSSHAVFDDRTYYMITNTITP